MNMTRHFRELPVLTSRQLLRAILVASISIVALAQTAPKDTATLVQRAKRETTTLVFEEVPRLSRYEQPVLYARLVQLWAGSSNTDVDAWKKSALSGIARRPTDKPEENRQRIVAASR